MDKNVSEFEKKRQERIKRNAAKLAELKEAAEQVAQPMRAKKAQQAAKQQAAREALASGTRRPPTARAAAARTRARLQQQTATDADAAAGNGSGSDTEGSSHMSVPEDRAGDTAVDDYDPLVDDAAESSQEQGGSESLVNSDSDAEDGAPTEADMLAMMEEDEDAQLQLALAMSMSADAGHSEGAGPVPVPEAAAQQPAKRAHKSGTPPSAKGTAANAEAAGTASKKNGRQQKRKRKQDTEPPSQQDIAAVFQMFNVQSMSALIASDIEKVALDTLGIDHAEGRLHNMMKRACDILDLQQARLTCEDFARLVRHYCGGS